MFMYWYPIESIKYKSIATTFAGRTHITNTIDENVCQDDEVVGQLQHTRRKRKVPKYKIVVNCF